MHSRPWHRYRVHSDHGNKTIICQQIQGACTQDHVTDSNRYRGVLVCTPHDHGTCSDRYSVHSRPCMATDDARYTEDHGNRYRSATQNHGNRYKCALKAQIQRCTQNHHSDTRVLWHKYRGTLSAHKPWHRHRVLHSHRYRVL